MSVCNKMEQFICEFCGSEFSRNNNLTKHLKTSKKCLERRPKNEIKCTWCEEVFLTKDRLEKHSSKCGVDKEIAFITVLEKNKALTEEKNKLLEEKNKLLENNIKQLEEKDKHIKDLEEKLFKLANKTSTTNNTTYNITLNCDKPLLLSTERVTNLMWKYLTVEDIKKGGEGICRWFLKYVAINDKGKISIECTDKTRKIFKYIDGEDKLNTKTGEEIADLIRICRNDSGFYNQSPQGIEHQKYVKDNDIIEPSLSFEKSFIRLLSEKTYKENLNSLLN